MEPRKKDELDISSVIVHTVIKHKGKLFERVTLNGVLIKWQYTDRSNVDILKEKELEEAFIDTQTYTARTIRRFESYIQNS